MNLIQLSEHLHRLATAGRLVADGPSKLMALANALPAPVLPSTLLDLVQRIDQFARVRDLAEPHKALMFSASLAGLYARFELSSPLGDADARAIARAAEAFQLAEHGAGRGVDFAEAVAHVTKGAAVPELTCTAHAVPRQEGGAS